MIGALVKKVYRWNPNTCDCDCNKLCKIDEYLDQKCLYKTCLTVKLVLECEGETLDTTETSLNDETEI